MSPRLKAIQDAFPSCFDAICWVELYGCPSPDDEPGTPSMLEFAAANHVMPDKLAEVIRETMRDMIRDGEKGRHAECLLQTVHPSFEVYLAHRLLSFCVDGV